MNSTLIAEEEAAGVAAHAFGVVNEKNAEQFAEAMTGIIGLFTIIHWLSFLSRRYGRGKKSTVGTYVSACWRAIRSMMNRKPPGFSSTGHLAIYLLYFAINITLIFVNMEWSMLTNFGKRLGWVTTSNLVLTIFLALKNTPLSFLTHYSHNALNVLHRCAGYGTITLGLTHGVVYIVAQYRIHDLAYLTIWDNVAGILAGLSFLFIGLTATFLRSSTYEFFYASHIFLFLTVMVMSGFHNPILSRDTLVVIITGSCLWFSDRLIRSSRMLLYSFGNFATVIPLENGGTRILLHKAPLWAKAGMHVFLWIPSIRKFETHPFTIVRVQDGGAEFFVAKQDGFTRDLYDFAMRNPRVSIRASVDGPYGTMPSFRDADKVVLIAGGSGASHSAGVAVELARMGMKNMEIEFVWVLRDISRLSWYSTELQELKTAPNVAIKLYCTNSSSSSDSTPEQTSGNTSDASDRPLHMPRKPQRALSTPTTRIQPQHEESDIEKNSLSAMEIMTPTAAELLQGLKLRSGRPDLDAMIRRSVGEAGNEGRVLICACGPTAMTNQIQKTVSEILGENLRLGAGIEMHLEAFGW